MDSGNFWALILGLIFTMFGGMAFCYGLVKLAEKIVHRVQAKRLIPVSAPPIPRAA